MQTQQYNVFDTKKFINNRLNNIRNEKLISTHKTNFVTYTYKKSKQVAKNGYQTATKYETNLPPLEAWTKNISTKMADSEFRNSIKTSKAKLTNQNTRKRNYCGQ